VIVLDTHAWIWWAGASPRLTPRAARTIEQAEAVGTAAISCWELAMCLRLPNVGDQRRREASSAGSACWAAFAANR
jgi:PIN domain nuclease of toxin-antitoxin system